MQKAGSEGTRVIYLLSMAVAEEYRRKGIATSLIDYVKNLYPNYTLIGDVSNANSLEIYHRLGFTVEKLAEDYHLIEKRPAISLADISIGEQVKLAVPSARVIEKFLSGRTIPYRTQQLMGYCVKQLADMDVFIEDPEEITDLLIIEISYQELLGYQRLINISPIRN